MLQLKNIKKDYQAGNSVVHALKGISINFREHEFVSILGQSGCGKTTMLNIIGGLDQYTEGDLVINGKSTKDFKDRDWDAYRNHSIGFVFQSYNLIPHQSVLANVELALTLSGVGKAERRKRAKQALEQVGLGDQLKKKPGEMSGGQMQRVAIARALVNNPEIILADEPTGALDSETSVQVMEILKEVSKDHLVIMVTHNPDLANQYSSRIIRMLDGVILSDSKPIEESEIKELKEEENKRNESQKSKKRVKKPSMSFGTSFSLSLKNLFTKKGRTILTAFAGSIGIIGIALIYAVSNGMTAYIDSVQEETLSSYPLTIEASTVDISTLMQTFLNIKPDEENTHGDDAVYSKAAIYDMINALNTLESTENDLVSFKAYLDNELSDKSNEKLVNAVNGVKYTYDFDLLVYTENVDGDIMYSDSQKILMDSIKDNLGMDMSSMLALRENSGFSETTMSNMSMSGRSTVLWEEMLSGTDGELINPLIKDQYNLIYGEWPSAANEVVLVVDRRNELPDLTLYALGLKSQDEIEKVFNAVKNKTEVDMKQEKYSYKEICDRDYKVILNSDCYSYDEKSDTYTDLRDSDAGLKYLYENAYDLKVTGIIRPDEDATAPMLSGSIVYTKLLTEYIIDHTGDSDAVKAQLADETKDIFTGLPFNENTGNLDVKEKADYFRNYIDTLNTEQKAKAYIDIKSIPDDEVIENAKKQAREQYSDDEIKGMIAKGMAEQLSVSESEVTKYIDSMSDEDLNELFDTAITEETKRQYAEGVIAQFAQVPSEQISMMFDTEKADYSDDDCAKYYDNILEFSDNTLKSNLSALGCVDLDSPATVNIYASSFENKDIIVEMIDDYNDSVEELKQISYTDYIGILMSSITTIINAITYVLIAFVAISLVVSSIMIGVITLISVQERTKEIGILRAIGASKKNVSSMFNAETLIIGFVSGVLGILITYVLCIPINAIIQHLTEINNLAAQLPVHIGLILVGISMLLTLIAGIIPSRSAAKKDPVVALRTE